MPALAPVAKVVAVRMLGVDAADNRVGTHFDISYASAAPTVAQLNTFATAVATAWESDLVGLVSTDFTLDLVTAVDLTSPTASSGEAVVSHAGTRSGTALPLSAAFTLNYLTGLRRRGGRWHGQHRFGVIGDLQTPQTWTSSFITSVLTSWGNFMTAVLAAGWASSGSLAHVGVQYYGPPNRTITSSTGRVRTVSTALVTPGQYAVTGYAAYSRIGSQRKRLGKSGT